MLSCVNESFWTSAKKFRDQESFSDIRLTTVGKEGEEVVFWAHKIILSSRSRFFEHSLNGPENHLDVFKFEDVPECSLKTLLDFIYMQISLSTLKEDVYALKLAQYLEIKGSDDADIAEFENQIQTYARTVRVPIRRPKTHGTILSSEAVEEIIRTQQDQRKNYRSKNLWPSSTPPPDVNTGGFLHTVHSDPEFDYVSSPTQDQEPEREEQEAIRIDPYEEECFIENQPGSQPEDSFRAEDPATESLALDFMPDPTTQQDVCVEEAVIAVEVEDLNPGMQVGLEQCDGVLDGSHRDDENTQVGVSVKDEEISVRVEHTNAFQCEHCSVVEPTIFALRRHLKQKHAISDPSYSCSKCQLRFKYKRMFFAHLVKEHGEKPYTCTLCPSTFTSSEGLYHHQNTLHKRLTYHKCSHCAKVFKVPGQLQAHLRNTHLLGKSMEVCGLCGRPFKQMSSLNRHLRTFHSHTRKFSCPECNSSFKTNDDMQKHLRLHYKPEKLKRPKNPMNQDYPCRYCGKVFKNFFYRKSHERLQHISLTNNIEIVCTTCGKSFRNQHYLRLHQNNVHRPKRFSCSRCRKPFSFQYELSRHMPKCKGLPNSLKPFHCQYCYMSFTMKGNLTKHLSCGRCKRQPKQYQYQYVLMDSPQSMFTGIDPATSQFGALVDASMPLWSLPNPDLSSVDVVNQGVSEMTDSSQIHIPDAFIETPGQ